MLIAGWLATGTGLGNLLDQARGRLDYGMIWAVATVAVLPYEAVAALERHVPARFGATP